MGAKEKAEAKIQRVLNRLTAAEVDELAPDRGEFKAVAEAVMAWYQLLFASGIVNRQNEKAMEVLASSLLVLGTLVKTTYALGVRRGRRAGGGGRS